MSNIPQRPIGKPLLMIFGIIGILIYFYNQGPKESTFSPDFQQTTLHSTEPTFIPQTKDVKSDCVTQATKYYEDNKSKGLSNETMIFGINSIYRVCLANKGYTPEDLLSYPENQEGGGSSGIAGQVSSNDYGSYKQDMSQRCQKEYSEYNTCLSEYNAKMAEYNQCQLEAYDSNSYRYKGFCFKPSKYCSKPLCNL